MKPAATPGAVGDRCPTCGHPLHRAPAEKPKPMPPPALLKHYELERRYRVMRMNGGFV